MRKGLSLITDFGCSNKCSYCIWKIAGRYKGPDESTCRPKHALKVLLHQLEHNPEFSELKKFSISGGGDPLNQFQTNWHFWKDIFEICKFYELKIDVHTSDFFTFRKIIQHDCYEAEEMFEANKKFINRMVFHILTTSPNYNFNMFDVSKDLDSIIKKPYNYRFVIVINSNVSVKQLSLFEKYFRYHAKKDDQIAYRELYGHEYLKHSEDVLTFAKQIQDRIPNGKFIKQDDYNWYIMPDGTLTDKFVE